MRTDLRVFQTAVILSALLASAGSASAQMCACNTTSPFGSCTHKTAPYPDDFPGAAAIAPRIAQPAFLYVADLYSGFTYRYIATNFQAAPDLVLVSPAGSNATTGITFRLEGSDPRLYWASEGLLLRTDLDGGLRGTPVEVDLEQLATLVRALPDEVITEAGQSPASVRDMKTGSLGGITYHTTRNAFWGVDIVNDLYFEFRDTGEIVVEAGRPVFFFNPKRNRLTGGAYGNSITYAQTPTGQFFDIPVGTIADGKPTEVQRVVASDGGPSGARIGDGAGILYSLGATLGSPKFVTGIAYWPDSCGANQSSEILLDLDTVGGAPKIIEVSADEPTTATIANFGCLSAAPASVTLTWNKTKPYTNLTISRKRLNSPEPAVVVFQNADFANDPQTFVDTSLLDATYQYSAVVTSGAAALAPVTCDVTLGRGSLVAHRKVSDAIQTPYALTVTTDKVIVADRDTGDAEVLTLDLQPSSTLNGPFEGGVIGLSYDSKDGSLYWLRNAGGPHYLQKTTLAGELQGNQIPVQVPASITKVPALGDISYDSGFDGFWTTDLVSERIFGISPTGAVLDAFKTTAIPSPQAGALLSGGISVTASAPTKVTVDIPIGTKADDLIREVGRYEYTRANLAAPPTEVFKIDLLTTTGSAAVGGVDVVSTGGEQFAFVVGTDTRAVYKLRLTGTPGADPFRRGDVNNDGSVNISDPSALLSFLFKGGTAPTCQRAGDVNDSGTLDITDAIEVFNYLFRSGTPPRPPFPACGVDLSSPLTCSNLGCTGG